MHYRVLGVDSLRIQGPVEREYLNNSGQAGQSDDAIEGSAPRGSFLVFSKPFLQVRLGHELRNWDCRAFYSHARTRPARALGTPPAMMRPIASNVVVPLDESFAPGSARAAGGKKRLTSANVPENCTPPYTTRIRKWCANSPALVNNYILLLLFLNSAYTVTVFVIHVDPDIAGIFFGNTELNAASRLNPSISLNVFVMITCVVIEFISVRAIVRLACRRNKKKRAAADRKQSKYQVFRLLRKLSQWTGPGSPYWGYFTIGLDAMQAVRLFLLRGARARPTHGENPFPPSPLHQSPPLPSRLPSACRIVPCPTDPERIACGRSFYFRSTTSSSMRNAQRSAQRCCNRHSIPPPPPLAVLPCAPPSDPTLIPHPNLPPSPQGLQFANVLDLAAIGIPSSWLFVYIGFIVVKSICAVFLTMKRTVPLISAVLLVDSTVSLFCKSPRARAPEIRPENLHIPVHTHTLNSTHIARATRSAAHAKCPPLEVEFCRLPYSSVSQSAPPTS